MEANAGRTEFDVGSIFRSFGQAYERQHLLSSSQRKALRALAVCRTEFLGGHLEQCDSCGFEQPQYNSCRNVNCPKCQGIERRRWVESRLGEMLPVPYFHVVFTLPSILLNRGITDAELYRLLFSASSRTLLNFFRTYFGGEPGLISVLHTWGQTMCHHPHVHFLVTGGCLCFDSKRWISTQPDYLFDVKALSREFRHRFLKGLEKIEGILSTGSGFAGQDWVVYCQKPFASPEKVIEYLGRYVYRTAISNRRIKSVSNGEVTFEYKDYRDKDENGVPKHKSMTVPALTFIGLFLQHVLPGRFRRIRYYGFLAGRERYTKLDRCRELVAHLYEQSESPSEGSELAEDRICPQCQKGNLLAIHELKPIRPPPILFANEVTYGHVA